MTKFLCALILPFTVFFTLSAAARSGGGGGMDAGGGSGMALLFRNEALQAAKSIAALPKFPLSQKQFEELVRSTRVEFVDKQLLNERGEIVNALASRPRKLIQVHVAEFMSIFMAPKLVLPFIVHNYLKIAGIDDNNRKYSNQLVGVSGKTRVNISCEAASSDNDFIYNEFLFYKETDTNNDGKSDARSTLVYSISEESLRWQYEAPIAAKSDDGVLLMWIDMGISNHKIFLPGEFLKDPKATTQFQAYYISAPGEKTAKYRTFTCKHSNSEVFRKTANTPTEAPNAPAKDDTGLDKEDILKAMETEFLAMVLRQATYVANNVHRMPGFPLSKEKFLELIRTARLELTNEELIEPGGMVVDALNYPSKKLIRFNFTRILFQPPRTMLQLVTHEFLGLARIDDRNYSISSRIYELEGELAAHISCEMQNAAGKTTVAFKAFDLTGLQDWSETKLSAQLDKPNGSSVTLQTPLFLRELNLDDVTSGVLWKAYQILWVSENEIPYQLYLTKDLLEKKETFQTPYYTVAKDGVDNFTNPTGMMTCRILK